MTDELTLAAGAARARVSLAGAELAAWSVAGRPLLWSKDASFWNETAPILFPLVGWTRAGKIRVEGRDHPLGLHGFARAMRFSGALIGEGRARLSLASDAETLKLYPFAFWLGVHYALFETAIAVQLTVKNRGDAPMPYACGLHPGFCWPFAGGAQEDYRAVFAADEAPDVPMISPAGLFRRERRKIPLAGRLLPLSPRLFAQEALCFLDARSRSLAFEGPRSASIRIESSNFPHLALWSRPGAPFLCVENWTGYSDPEDFSGELRDKPSMRLLAPGGVAHHVVRYSFAPPAA